MCHRRTPSSSAAGLARNSHRYKFSRPIGEIRRACWQPSFLLAGAAGRGPSAAATGQTIAVVRRRNASLGTSRAYPYPLTPTSHPRLDGLAAGGNKAFDGSRRDTGLLGGLG